MEPYEGLIMQYPQNPYGAYMGGSQWNRNPGFAGTYGVVGNLGIDPRRGGPISKSYGPGEWPSQLMGQSAIGLPTRGGPSIFERLGAVNGGVPITELAPRGPVGNAGHFTGDRNSMIAQLANQNAIARGPSAAGNDAWSNYRHMVSNAGQQTQTGFNPMSMFSGGGGNPISSLSKIAQFASKFKPGNTISSLFSQGGSVNSLLGKSALGSSIGAAPAWALPVAGLAIGGGLAYLNKRSKQKKEQKYQMGQRDLIKQANANGQYLTGGLGNFGPAKPY